MTLPTPHGDKLIALLQNEKLPSGDRVNLQQSLERYRLWLTSLKQIPTGLNDVENSVRLLNEYRTFVDLELIFDSESDFLHRQRGQLKLDNSVVEEFLPHLVSIVFPELSTIFRTGPQLCFSALYFSSTIRTPLSSPGARTRTKNQDFSISKRVYLRSSFHPNHEEAVDHLEVNLGYLNAECKTNLDKTMFQEACATAHDVKAAVPGSKYVLLCD